MIRNGEELDYPDEKVGYIDVLNDDFYGTGHHNHSGLGPLLIRGNGVSFDNLNFANEY